MVPLSPRRLTGGISDRYRGQTPQKKPLNKRETAVNSFKKTPKKVTHFLPYKSGKNSTNY